MGIRFIEPLESRRLLAADLTAAIVSETLPDSITLGGKQKPAKAAILVNSSEAIGKKTKGNVAVAVALKDSLGGLHTLGTGKVKLPKLGKTTVKLKYPTDLTAGAYTLVASISTTAITDANLTNNTVTGQSFAISSPGGGNNNGGGTLSSIGLGTKLTFKTTKSIGHGGTGFESGTWNDDTGKSGTFYFTTSGTNNGLLGMNIDPGNTPLGLITITVNKGSPKLGGKTFNFTAGQSHTLGFFTVAGTDYNFTNKK